MVTMFIDTLQPPFYEKMVRNVLSNFSVLVIIDERIDVGVRNLKIAHMRGKRYRVLLIKAQWWDFSGNIQLPTSFSTKYPDNHPTTLYLPLPLLNPLSNTTPSPISTYAKLPSTSTSDHIASKHPSRTI
ncbi:hypothetical protein CR513_42034, partial [Mucuna pruriens]